MPDDREPVTQAPLCVVLISVTTSSETDFSGQAACGSRTQVLGQKELCTAPF